MHGHTHTHTHTHTHIHIHIRTQASEQKYKQQLSEDQVTDDVKFTYAWHLVKSQYKNDIRKGIRLMEGTQLSAPLISTHQPINRARYQTQQTTGCPMDSHVTSVAQ